VRYYDAAGNSADSATVDSYFDDIAPDNVASVTGERFQAPNSNAGITVTGASDANSGFSHHEVYISTTSSSAGFSYLGDTYWTGSKWYYLYVTSYLGQQRWFKAYAVDNAGNKSPISSSFWTDTW
jgi:hypothetical protein